MIIKLKKGLKNPSLFLLYFLNFKICRILPDKTFLKIKYKLLMNVKLDLTNPTTFNEKLQWLKINDRNPKYPSLVDKYEVRNYIKKTIGEEYLIPLLGVWDNYDDIDFESLPNQFVLKPTHTSGDVFICKNKSTINFISLRKEVKKWLKQKYFWKHREWPYKFIKPKIICEELMVDDSGSDLKDYKLMCFNGEVKIIQVISGRTKKGYYIDHFDTNWNKLNIERKNKIRNPKEITKPSNLKDMILIANRLSRGLSFCRIDLYLTQKHIFFGEITFYPMSGFLDFKNKQTDIELGNMLKLLIPQ
ncbi:MAG: ATP-grasp fold amidoligase family protein [Sphaerochaetaceae bacterium]|nr:ATP-grasp fold amidoligase family protein [Sphaerochaetaceae bacterium]